MAGSIPRVAFFADSFHEVNGVALTSRQLASYAGRKGFPFLSVHRGPDNQLIENGSVVTVEFARSFASVALDRDLYFDPLLWRHRKRIRRALEEFHPDVIHITGPGDLGIAGMYEAYRMRLPLVAAWHTNLHEYAGRRAHKLLAFFPQRLRQWITGWAESRSLDACMRFYRVARVCLAPNKELIELLERRTGKPCLLMERGADTVLFDPAKRQRSDSVFTIGYVGRITPEKNVRFFERLEKALEARGFEFRITLVGGGSEVEWLRENLQRAQLPGVLKGEALARAYANFDLFVFPSWTDTFGNVVVEAFASGVPAVVNAGGGPKFIVREGVSGLVARDDDAMIELVAGLMADRPRLAAMQAAAREQACAASWDAVFGRVYEAYTMATAR